jgi:hypothetical protein
MNLTSKELWGLIHGMVLGGLFLLTFAGGLAGLYSLRPEWITVTGLQERMRRLDIGTILMAIVAWLPCIPGTFIVYTWYRAAPPNGTEGDALRAFPRYFLLANEGLKAWHNFGMEWKEHVAWFAPILATAVAYIVWRYRGQLAGNATLRTIAIWMFLLAFAAAAVAGLMGALITKAAPIL